jgi:UDP-N-acetylglucosamine--N-acetylmuramyl-(pentapeptide) pyrophosphoryl-undecaprenol N-acetylglucosamine transferase
MQGIPLKVVIAGGGTGGHVLPAVAVIDELRARVAEIELLWIGSRDGIEVSSATDQRVPYRAIQTGKLRRYVDLENAIDTLRLPVGIAQAWTILKQFKPDVILSTGGYVSVPTVIAGSRLAPILTHEQTVVLGLATNINLRFADVLAISYGQTQQHLQECKKRVVCTGNPTRATLHSGAAPMCHQRFGFSDELPLVYVTGGARGSKPINERIEAILHDLLRHCQVLHQTGAASANGDAPRLREVREKLPQQLKQRYIVTEFVGEELPDVYAAADLVVARAGAGTVAELAALGKPSVLIPLPGSGRGEQQANATMLQSLDAAVAIDQDQASPERLKETILSLLRDPERRHRMSANAQRLAYPKAAAHLCDELISLAATKATHRSAVRAMPTTRG